MDELIRKQDAADLLRMAIIDGWEPEYAEDKLKALPPVQPKGTKLSTVCLLCKKPAVTFNTEDDIPYTNYSYCEDCLRKGLKLLKAQNKMLPPVQPERIKGHWIEITSINHTYKCSVCGRLLVNITDGKNNVAKNYPYCHCGADMRGGKDGND